MRHDIHLVHALASTRRKWTQQERCKRCRSSVLCDGFWHCRRMQMCLDLACGDVRRSCDNQRIVCDGKTWQYAEVSNA